MPSYKPTGGDSGSSTLEGLAIGLGGLGQAMSGWSQARAQKRQAKQSSAAAKADLEAKAQAIASAKGAESRAVDKAKMDKQKAEQGLELGKQQLELGEMAIDAGSTADEARKHAEKLRAEQAAANASWDAWGHLNWRINSGEIPPGEKVPIPARWPWSALVNEYNIPNAKKGWMVGGDPETGEVGYIEIELDDGEKIQVDPYGQQMQFTAKISDETWDRWADRIESGQTAAASAGIDVDKMREHNLSLAAAEDEAKMAHDNFKRINRELNDLRVAAADSMDAAGTGIHLEVANKKNEIEEAKQEQVSAQKKLNAQRKAILDMTGGAPKPRPRRRITPRDKQAAPPPAPDPGGGLPARPQGLPRMSSNELYNIEVDMGLGPAGDRVKAAPPGASGPQFAPQAPQAPPAPVTPMTKQYDANGDGSLGPQEQRQRDSAISAAKGILAKYEEVSTSGDQRAMGQFINKQWPSFGGFPAGPLTEEKRQYLEKLVREVDSLVQKSARTDAQAMVPQRMRPDANQQAGLPV